jgi:hypothetical protein
MYVPRGMGFGPAKMPQPFFGVCRIVREYQYHVHGIRLVDLDNIDVDGAAVLDDLLEQ